MPRKNTFFTPDTSDMAYFKAVTHLYQRKLIFVLISNEETEKNCIFGNAMPGDQESLKLGLMHLE